MRQAREQRRGQTMIIVAMLGTFITALGGLAVDVVFAYTVKVRMSTAVDSAALAASRALGRGVSVGEQSTEVSRVAQMFFNANFPSGYLLTKNTTFKPVKIAGKGLDPSESPLFEDDQSLQPGVREIRLGVEANVPTFFMRVFGKRYVNVKANAYAARRDTNVMMVIDRSASLKWAGAWDDVQAAAVNFLDRFDNNRDKVGVVTFGTSANIDVPLNTGFKNGNVARNAIMNQTVPDSAYTNAGLGMWLGYAELLRVQDQNALNVIVFFTDGQPSAFPGRFRVRRSHERYYSSDDYCSSSYVNGVMGAYQDTSVWNQPRFYDMTGLWKQEAGPVPVRGGATDRDHVRVNGCTISSWGGDVERMIKYGENLPQDWTATSGSLSKTFCVDNNPTSGCLGNAGNYTYYTYDTRFWSNDNSSSNKTFRGTNVHNAAKNVLLNVAQEARQDTLLGQVTIYSIGLGGSGYDADAGLLKRVSNDPTDTYGVTVQTSSTEPTGAYVYAPTIDDVKKAFDKVRSHVVRLTL